MGDEMTNLSDLRRDLYAKARKSDVPPDIRIILERMITQIDSRRSEYPFTDQLAHSYRMLEHRMAGGEWPDLTHDQISSALGLQDNRAPE